MRFVSPQIRLSIALVTLFSFFNIAPCFAGAVSADLAITAARGWLHLDSTPLGMATASRLPAEVESFDDDQNRVLYYVVKLAPQGIVIVSGDDRLVPVIAWLPRATAFAAKETNPLYTLLENDMRDRLDQIQSNVVRDKQANPLWQTLYTAATTPGTRTLDTDPTDMRVAAFVQSTWSQSSIYIYQSGQYEAVPLYNYYTPNNYVCGCVATTMAQLMRYHQYPTTNIPTQTFDITVDGTPTTATLRGSDGAGGPYEWQNMVLSPDESITETQRQAIGALTYDAAVSANMKFTQYSSSASIYNASNAFLSVFGYGNSIYSYDADNFGSSLSTILNTNCDARLPTILSIKRTGGGHAVVCDGYGYQLSVLYHHLNMGWGGMDNAWYNLPDIDTSSYDYTSINSIVYNVFPTGTGEIISGRVTTKNGTPIEGVTITATGGNGGPYTATTDAYGVYALPSIPSTTTFTIHAEKSGFSFEDRLAITGHSSYSSIGNVWSIDFNDMTPFDPTTFLSALLLTVLN